MDACYPIILWLRYPYFIYMQRFLIVVCCCSFYSKNEFTRQNCQGSRSKIKRIKTKTSITHTHIQTIYSGYSGFSFSYVFCYFFCCCSFILDLFSLKKNNLSKVYVRSYSLRLFIKIT